jgi:Ca-activated chloride channel homolog
VTRITAAAVLALTAAPGFAAQAAQVPTFPSETQLVYVRFHVERKGGFVTEVAKEQIRVLEDGRPQKVAVLETPGSDRTIHPEVTLVLDVSSSVMDDRLLDQALVRQVLMGGLGAGATVGLCAFGGKLECFAEPTTDAAVILEAFSRAMAFGVETRRSGTRLYESVADVAKQAGARGGRAQRAMILFTDALDTKGGKIDQAIDAAVAADVRVYAIKVSQAFQDNAPGRGGFSRGGGPGRVMYDYKKLELDALPDETGGRSFEPGTLDDQSLAKILSEIAAEISREIVVGYEPQGPPTGKKRKVKVELADRSLGRIPDGERTIVR